MSLRKLTELLEDQKVEYQPVPHPTAYTAQETAASAHVPGKEVAKTVMVKVDGKLTMAVLPASYHIRLDRLKDALGADRVELAREEEFSGQFPDCETGAMPPFGNIFGLETFVDQSLAEDERISFNAGSHDELLRMAYSDYERIANPVRLQFSDRA